MTYTIEMPTMPPALKEFEVESWLVSPGDTVSVGEALCTLFANPAHRADRLSWRQRRNVARRGVSGSGTESTRITVFSREAGEMVAVRAAQGTRIRSGDVLADASLPTGGAGRFAVVAEVTGGETDVD